MPEETAPTPRRRSPVPARAATAAAKPQDAGQAPRARPTPPGGTRHAAPGAGCRCGRGKPSPTAGILPVAWAILCAAALPFRIVAWLLEAAVAAAMVGAMAVAWAWWTGWIGDDQVAGFLGQLGARGLSVLSKSGIL